jgi:hypothetical protein
MAFPEDHVLVTFGGGLAAGAEQWVCGIRMKYVGPFGDASGHPEAVATYLPNVKDKLATYWGQIKPFIASSTTLAWVKINAIGTDGKYRLGSTNLYTWTTPIPGEHGSLPPTEVSMAVSTRTGLTRGLAHAGRFYLPTPSWAVDANGLWAVDKATNMAGWAATFLSDLSDATDVLTVNMYRPAVFSRVGAGAVHDITSVAVGRVPDVQRSRRTKLKESYVAHAVTY